MVAQAAWNWWKFEDAGKKLAHTLETRRSWVLCPPCASSYLDGAFVMERKVRRSKNTIALCKPSNKFISFPALVAWSSATSTEQQLSGPSMSNIHPYLLPATKNKFANFFSSGFEEKSCILLVPHKTHSPIHSKGNNTMNKAKLFQEEHKCNCLFTHYNSKLQSFLAVMANLQRVCFVVPSCNLL
jgi:hypothetical protein